MVFCSPVCIWRCHAVLAGETDLPVLWGQDSTRSPEMPTLSYVFTNGRGTGKNLSDLSDDGWGQYVVIHGLVGCVFRMVLNGVMRRA